VPAFFPPDVLFLAVEYSDLTLLQLMTNTLHALPVLQVHSRGKRYRYRGPHKLEPILSFLSRALVRGSSGSDWFAGCVAAAAAVLTGPPSS